MRGDFSSSALAEYFVPRQICFLNAGVEANRAVRCRLCPLSKRTVSATRQRYFGRHPAGVNHLVKWFRKLLTRRKFVVVGATVETEKPADVVGYHLELPYFAYS